MGLYARLFYKPDYGFCWQIVGEVALISVNSFMLPKIRC
jgi:hypothetical protein